MHSIFFIVPYPDRIFVTCSSGTSVFAIFFSYSIFYLSAQARRFSRLLSVEPIHVWEREVGKSSNSEDSFIFFYGLSPSIKLLTSLDCLARREALESTLVVFLRDQISVCSCLTYRLQASINQKRVMRYRFLVMVFLLMGWLHWGQLTGLLASFLMSSRMQGAQQLCWLMHMMTGAYQLWSNQPMHRKHSCSTLLVMSDWISVFMSCGLISSIL